MKVSIITVSYNSAKTISDAMESVLRQTYQDIEYLVIDGGSQDGTVDIIRNYEYRFGHRLKWVSEKDKGLYDAMNKGIRMAGGDVVGMLNSDDYFTSDDVIAHVASVFAKENTDAVYGDIHFIHSGRPDKSVRYYSSKLFRPFWLHFGFMPAHPSFYLRREIYEHAGGYKTDYKIAADYEMMVRLFCKYKIKSRYIQRDFVTMRMGGASTKNIQSRLVSIKEDVRACRENDIYTNSLMICCKFFYKIFQLKF